MGLAVDLHTSLDFPDQTDLPLWDASDCIVPWGSGYKLASPVALVSAGRISWPPYSEATDPVEARGVVLAPTPMVVLNTASEATRIKAGSNRHDSLSRVCLQGEVLGFPAVHVPQLALKPGHLLPDIGFLVSSGLTPSRHLMLVRVTGAQETSYFFPYHRCE